MNRILSITVSIIVLTSAVSAFAAPMYSAPAGFKAEPLFSTPSETLIEGFDMDSDGNAYYIETAYQWYGDPVNWYMPESSALKKRAPDGATQTLYNFSSGVWGSFVRLVGDNVWFGNSSDNVIRSISTGGGAAEDIITLSGQYDLKVNGSEQVFVSAKPGAGNNIYHIVEDELGDWQADLIAEMGGYSGPIEFDADGNLYYGFPNYSAGEVVYFNASDIAAATAEEDYENAELGSADWTSYCTGLSACSFLQFDDDAMSTPDLFSSSWQSVVDRVYGQDSADGFGSSPNWSGLGHMAFVPGANDFEPFTCGGGELYLLATDYSYGEYNSTIFGITAVPEPSTILMVLSGLAAGAGILVRKFR